MSDFNEELRQTYEKHQHLLLVDRHLKQLNEQLTTAYRDLEKLEKKLREEFKDLEDLEKLSVRGLFYQVLGSKEEQIDKERQEYLQASLKYDEAKKSIALLEYEQKLLEGKTRDIPNIEKQLNLLIKLREKSMIESGSPAGKQIMDLLLVMDTTRDFVITIDQIKKGGREIMLLLDKMIGHLQQARNWGQWQQTGRSRNRSYFKHNEIDKARDLAYHAKHLLVRFENDLRHIYGNQQFRLHLDVNSFSRFTDIFFDNLISDWIVQQKIQNALANVISVRDKVVRFLQSLDAEISRANDKLSQLEEQRKQLIIQS
jgi:hypothetical protein